MASRSLGACGWALFSTFYTHTRTVADTELPINIIQHHRAHTHTRKLDQICCTDWHPYKFKIRHATHGPVCACEMQMCAHIFATHTCARIDIICVCVRVCARVQCKAARKTSSRCAGGVFGLFVGAPLRCELNLFTM